MASVQSESPLETDRENGADSAESADGAYAAAGQPHTTELTVWDVPSAVIAAERLRFLVGARCGAGCDLGGRELGVYDQSGACVATATLDREVWPGTDALYFAEVETCAPTAAGSHSWAVKFAGWDGEPPHEARAYPVALYVVVAPECEVTVSVVDRETQRPLAGASVVIHPYRGVTDESGNVHVRVAKGQHDMLVSGRGHMPVCNAIDATANIVVRVELDIDRPWVSPEEEAE